MKYIKLFEEFSRMNEAKELTRDALKKILIDKYGIKSVKDSEDFDGSKGGLWVSAEDGDLMPNKSDEIFSYYDETPKYDLGVHVDFSKFLDKSGWYAEFNDPGTVFIFPS